MIGYKEAAGCFYLLWPVALHYHPWGSNAREWKTKTDPIGCAPTSFYQGRKSPDQHQNQFSSCYSPYPHKHLECPVWLACWLTAAIPPACTGLKEKLPTQQMQSCSSRRYELRFRNISWGSWSFTSCIWCSRWDLWMKVQLVHWSSLQSSLSWSQALRVLPDTTGKRHLPRA